MTNLIDFLYTFSSSIGKLSSWVSGKDISGYTRQYAHLLIEEFSLVFIFYFLFLHLTPCGYRDLKKGPGGQIFLFQ